MSDKVHTLRLSRIAHELRGPAGVALGAAQELARQTGGGGEPFVGMMHRGLNRVLRIADRLGRASALENEIVDFNKRSLDLTEFVPKEVKAAIELEHKTNITIDVGTLPEASRVNADSEWLGFCMREIMANAIQHAKHKVSVSMTAQNGKFRVTIEDDGPGFRELPGFSFDAPPNPRRGVGLSLPICHCVLTRHHNGELVVDSSPLGGARVSFSLPAESP